MGSPIALRVGNTEWPKWTEVMSAEPVELSDKSRGRGAPLAPPPRGTPTSSACRKVQGFDEARPVLERASARETAARVALGAVAHKFLGELGDSPRQPYALDRPRRGAGRCTGADTRRLFRSPILA